MKMYKSVLDRVRILEQKNGIVYANTNGRLYKTAKVFFILSFIYAMFIKFMYFLGVALDTTSRVYETTTPAICTGVLVLGFVLLLFKQHIIGFLSLAVSSVMLMFVFNTQLLNGVEVMINHKFAWAHLIPLSLLIIFSFVMTVIGERDKYKLKKMYNKVINDIYEKYSVNVAKGEEIDEAEWEEFIEKFNPFDYGNQFVKKVNKSEEQNT
ncbi:MAG: hypothetical protein IJ948_04260 [Clostridia bacterium]|nr:hypothetical protein [Clostridia bacterium]